jgi:hypothetical protein
MLLVQIQLTLQLSLEVEVVVLINQDLMAEAAAEEAAEKGILQFLFLLLVTQFQSVAVDPQDLSEQVKVAKEVIQQV